MPTRSERVVVVGQIGQDLVLRVNVVPETGGSSRVSERRRLLGGKGANQSVALRQLGAQVALVGVVGNDDAGDGLLHDAVSDGIDVCGVVRRGASALLVDVIDEDANRMLIEHIPPESLLTSDDVTAAERLIRSAGTVSLQAQQPAQALVCAARLGRGAGATVALDGAPDSAVADDLVALADILRADATEAQALVGYPMTDPAIAQRACAELLARGPALVSVEVAGQGDVVAWRDGSRYLPHGEDRVIDPTGAGDAFMAALVRGLSLGWPNEQVADFAAAASAATVTHLGGRPNLA